MAYGVSYYPEIVRGETFYVAPRYTDLRYISEGTYGLVCSAVDHLRRQCVAIKKIKPFTRARIGSKTLREIMMLSRFKHDNVIDIVDIVLAPTHNPTPEIYLILSLMDTDLWRLLKVRRLPGEQIACFLYQILRGLKYIHSANVLHLDLKPGNILVNAQCYVKICDFGLARVISPEQSKFSNFVVTRGYRAPEMIFHTSAVSKAVDMWSVGCIFAEMLIGKPLINRKHYTEEVTSIFNIIGSPTAEELKCIKKEESRIFAASLPRRVREPFSHIFPGIDPIALNLLEMMLTFMPSKRVTAEEALDNSYLVRYHDPSNEPVVSEPFKSDAEFDNTSLDDIRDLIAVHANGYGMQRYR